MAHQILVSGKCSHRFLFSHHEPVQTDRRTDGRARQVMWPFRTATLYCVTINDRTSLTVKDIKLEGLSCLKSYDDIFCWLQQQNYAFIDGGS